MSHKTIPSTFLKNVMQNGIGRHVCQLQRITLSFCKTHPTSLGARDFIEDYLLNFTKANPGIVVYLKPRRFKTPMIKAEYLNGYTEEIALTKCDKDAVAQWIGLMRGRSGVQIQRLRKDWHTDTPSIQGVWHPFMFKDTKLSVTDMRDRKLSEYVSAYTSATQKLLQMNDLDEGSSGIAVGDKLSKSDISQDNGEGANVKR